MDCKDVRKKLAAYLDGQLSPLLSGIIQEHLEACPACRMEAQRLEGVWSLLDGVRVPPPPADLPDVIMKGIASGHGGPLSGAGRARFMSWSMVVTAAAAAAAGIMLGYLIGSALPEAGRSAAIETAPAAEVEPEDDLFSELPADSIAWTLVELLSEENGAGSANGEGKK